MKIPIKDKRLRIMVFATGCVLAADMHKDRARKGNLCKVDTDGTQQRPVMMGAVSAQHTHIIIMTIISEQ